MGDHHIIQIKLSSESKDGIMYLLRCQPLTPKRLVGRSLMELAEKWMRFYFVSVTAMLWGMWQEFKGFLFVVGKKHGGCVVLKWGLVQRIIILRMRCGFTSLFLCHNNGTRVPFFFFFI